MHEREMSTRKGLLGSENEELKRSMRSSFNLEHSTLEVRYKGCCKGVN